MFEPFSIFSFVVVAILEMVFSANWSSAYFKIGIPIYKKVYPYKGTTPNPFNETILNSAFKKSLVPSLIFKQIGPGEYAFREKLFQFTLVNYTPIMRGKLEINEISRDIRVTGYINWWIIVFIATSLIFFSADTPFVWFLFPFLGVLYWFQKPKYDKVAQFAYEWNSRDWSKN